MRKKLLRVFGLVIISIIFSTVYAASFQSLEQSSARLGTGNAGTTTNTEDAAIEFYNPAGIPLLGHPAVAIGGIGVFANISMHNAKAMTDNIANPPPTQITGKTKGPISEGIIPDFHFVQPITDRLGWGIGVTAPYGLETLYSNNSITRYFATKSRIHTANFDLGLGYRLTNKLSIGAAVDLEYMWAELDQAVDILSLTGGIIFPGDLLIKNQGDDWAPGFNLGAIYQLAPKTRVGVAYHSQVEHKIFGTSNIHGVPNKFLAKSFAKMLGFVDGKAHAKMTLPATLTFSIQHDVNDKWQLLADAQYTNWKVLKKLTLHLSAMPDKPQSVILKYNNTWRFAIGQNYKVTDKWTLRNGFAFDETPTNGKYKTARIPDGNRYWITLGTNYKFTKYLDADLDYGLIIFTQSKIHQEMEIIPKMLKTTLTAHYKGYANLIGLQINYHFDN